MERVDSRRICRCPQRCFAVCYIIIMLMTVSTVGVSSVFRDDVDHGAAMASVGIVSSCQGNCCGYVCCAHITLLPPVVVPHRTVR